MRTNSRRRGRGLALAVIAAAASLPQVAKAQQTGLFPLHPIKRHRVPCDHEDPIYKINKYQYFGYHPTCWHRFPDGWGCPSAEAPNREKSFAETPLGAAEGELPPGPGERPEIENPPARPRGGLPGVPREDSPFNQPQGAPGGTPGTPNTPNQPRRTDPFEDQDVRPQTNPPGQPAPANPPRGNEPGGSSPADQPNQNPTPCAARDEDDDGPVPGNSDGPVLAVPNISLPPLADAGSIYEPPPNQPASGDNASPSATSSTPPRRGMISGFLSNLGINWIRR